MGGVGGSAGLFSNAQDIAVIFQMLLNDGVYRDKRYFTPQTVEIFTRRILPNNRRGAGFDKPLENYDEKGNPCAKSASYLSFGHSGFTGCFVWADPANDMIFILLSNRVYPYQDNNKITKQNIRPLLQELGYQYLP
jgi:CubicO group peptidase (beta-lactamase class C family)